jgi:hypothetical protein
MSMKNRVCALNFGHKGNPWMASGQDGQFLEAAQWVFDNRDNLIAGYTLVGRITVMSN